MVKGLVLVTGGNRGLGYAICRKLVDSGNNVILAARNPTAGKEAGQQIEKETGKHGACIPVVLDQSLGTSIDSLVEEVKSKYDQKITALVNNAGILLRSWDKESFDLAKITNFSGPAILTHKLAPHLAEGCRVVMMSSGMGELSGFSRGSAYVQQILSAKSVSDLESMVFDPNDALKSGVYAPTYRLTKGMLNRVTQLFASDPVFTSRGITLNACCPGWCRTNMGGRNATKSPEQGADSALWFLNIEDPVNGEFRRDGNPLSF